METYEKNIEMSLKKTALILGDQLNRYLREMEDPEDIACNPGIFIFYLNAIQSIMREISLKSWKGGPLLLLRLRRQYKFYLEDEAL